MMSPNDPIDPVKKLDAATLKPTGLRVSGNAKPVEISTESQLFIDDHLVDQVESLFRRLNQPLKQSDPILAPQHPWEGCGIMYGQVIPHEGQYRLYYRCCHHTSLRNVDFQKQHGYTKTPIAMALSDDGIAWTRDPIAGAEPAGTNIILNDLVDCFSIVRDEEPTDPAKRFKAVCARREWFPGLTLAYSGDGIRWTIGQEHAVKNFGDRNSFWYDPIKKVYVAWSRCYPLHPSRVIAHMETPDFDNWTDPRASQPKLAMMPGRDDHPQTQFYGGYAFWYRSLYIAYLEVYYLHQQRIDTQLCCSRDGRAWTRLCHHDVFLPNGRHEDWDAFWITPTFNPPIQRGTELLIHYHGYCHPHSQPGFMDLALTGRSSFGLARLREDGFVSLDATGKEGVLLTKPLVGPAESRTLEINAGPFTHRTNERFRVQADILDENAVPVESHLIEAAPDSRKVWHRIGLAAPLPKTFRLQLRAVNARIYSFRVKP